MSFLRHGESIDPMICLPLGASSCAHSQRSSASMSSSRLFLGRLLSSRACLRFAGCERFSKTEPRRTMIFQRTASNPLTSCLSPRVQSRPSPLCRFFALKPRDAGAPSLWVPHPCGCPILVGAPSFACYWAKGWETHVPNRRRGCFFRRSWRKSGKHKFPTGALGHVPLLGTYFTTVCDSSHRVPSTRSGITT